ncbi:hypothetical protein CDD81_4168 [Ophiocordyceps australis]|uniref:Uncharacterized protein n=1 Tax=Ophiocordyceps australis TaxID=1399860 RepID=A0A2C5XW25_9HYPO|nr:hypothetical protein CDD81_4168 [Ophiocordyceps australis]
MLPSLPLHPPCTFGPVPRLDPAPHLNDLASLDEAPGTAIASHIKAASSCLGFLPRFNPALRLGSGLMPSLGPASRLGHLPHLDSMLRINPLSQFGPLSQAGLAVSAGLRRASASIPSPVFALPEFQLEPLHDDDARRT